MKICQWFIQLELAKKTPHLSQLLAQLVENSNYISEVSVVIGRATALDSPLHADFRVAVLGGIWSSPLFVHVGFKCVAVVVVMAGQCAAERIVP